MTFGFTLKVQVGLSTVSLLDTIHSTTSLSFLMEPLQTQLNALRDDGHLCQEVSIDYHQALRVHRIFSNCWQQRHNNHLCLFTCKKGLDQRYLFSQILLRNAFFMENCTPNKNLKSVLFYLKH